MHKNASSSKRFLISCLDTTTTIINLIIYHIAAKRKIFSKIFISNLKFEFNQKKN